MVPHSRAEMSAQLLDDWFSIRSNQVAKELLSELFSR
jgi:hypothetical protein